MSSKPQNMVLRELTQNYLQTLDLNNLPSPSTIEQELLEKIEEEYNAQHNCMCGKGDIRWSIPQRLPFPVIADIMAYCYDICLLSYTNYESDDDYNVLAIYQSSGENKGIYITKEDTFRKIASQYNYHLSTPDFKEILNLLRMKVPHKTRCMDKDLIAVNNGIFNYATKTLGSFTPEKVFITKSYVNYNPNASNVVIHNDEDGTDWDVESWISDLSDDPEIVQVLWEILGAIIRPHVRWNKSAWFYSEKGNNGKGTLCSLMRNLCGNSHVSIPLENFSKDFLLEPLTHASAIIVDENSVGSFVTNAANLKAVITNDVIQINRKFKMPITYQFFGFMVQCVNEMPRIKDKSDSFYRRQLFIPFNKCFTGKERKYIKNDYLKRTEVLEYVLYKILNMNYYTLSEPTACKNMLNLYKEFNDPVRQFFEDFEQQFVWDLLPFGFLYSLYKTWYKENNPTGGVQSRSTFVNELLCIVDESTTWYCTNRDKKIWTSNLMDKPEPLIAKYDLKDWMNPNYTGRDIDKLCKPKLAINYRGLQRYTNTTTNTEKETN